MEYGWTELYEKMRTFLSQFLLSSDVGQKDQLKIHRPEPTSEWGQGSGHQQRVSDRESL